MTTPQMQDSTDGPTHGEVLDEFAAEILDAPWGSIAKSELELKIFRLLTRTGAIDSTGSDGEIAARLQVPLSRVRTMRYRLDQRSVGEHFLPEVVARFEVHHDADHPDQVRLTIDSRYLRERFTEALRARRILVRRELAGEVLRLQLRDLVFFLLEEDEVAPADSERILAELAPMWESSERQTITDRVRATIDTLSSSASLTTMLLQSFLTSTPG